MAFNVNAEVLLSGPKNIKAVRSKIKTQLTGVSVPVKITFDKNAVKNLATFNRHLSVANANLKALSTHANAAAKSLGKITTATKKMADVNTQFAKASQNVNKNMAQTQKQVKATAGELESFGKDAALAIRRFSAFTLATGAIYGFVRAIKSGISEAIKFERELAKIVQVTGATGAKLQGLQSTIDGLAVGLGLSANELLEVSRIFAQTGQSIDQVRSSLTAVARASLAPTFGDIKTTTEGVVAALNQFSLGADRAEAVLGSLNAVSKKFAVEAEDLISVIRRAGGVFSASTQHLGAPEERLHELISIFTAVRSTTRESADTIATGLRTIFTRIQRPRTIKFLEQFGIQLRATTEDAKALGIAKGEFVGVFEAFSRISGKLGGLNTLGLAKVVEELGGIRQVGKLLPALREFEKAEKARGIALAGTGSISKDVAIATQTLSVQIEKLQQRFQKLIRDIAQSDTFQSMAKFAIATANAFVTLADSLRPILPMLTAVAGIKLTGALFGFTRGFIGGIKKGGGKSGVGASIGATVTGGGGTAAQASAKRQQLSMEKNVQALNNNTKALTTLTNNIKTLKTHAAQLTTHARQLTLQVPALIAALKGLPLAGMAPSRLRPKKRDGGIVQKFAKGGFVNGPSHANGGVQAELEGGEFVIPKKSMDGGKKHQKFAGGGVVLNLLPSKFGGLFLTPPDGKDGSLTATGQRVRNADAEQAIIAKMMKKKTTATRKKGTETSIDDKSFDRFGLSKNANMYKDAGNQKEITKFIETGKGNIDNIQGMKPAQRQAITKARASFKGGKLPFQNVAMPPRISSVKIAAAKGAVPSFIASTGDLNSGLEQESSAAAEEGISSAIERILKSGELDSVGAGKLKVPSKDIAKRVRNLFKDSEGKVNSAKAAIQGYILEGMIGAVSGLDPASSEATFDFKGLKGANKEGIGDLFGPASANIITKLEAADAKRALTSNAKDSIMQKSARYIAEPKRDLNKYVTGMPSRGFTDGGQADGNMPVAVSNGEILVSDPNEVNKKINELHSMNKTGSGDLSQIASASLIKGAGSGTSDSINMRVPDGSFVIKEKSSRQLGGGSLLAARGGHISGGSVSRQGLAKGGIAGMAGKLGGLEQISKISFLASAITTMDFSSMNGMLNTVSSLLLPLVLFGNKTEEASKSAGRLVGSLEKARKAQAKQSQQRSIHPPPIIGSKRDFANKTRTLRGDKTRSLSAEDRRAAIKARYYSKDRLNRRSVTSEGLLKKDRAGKVLRGVNKPKGGVGSLLGMVTGRGSGLLGAKGSAGIAGKLTGLAKGAAGGPGAIAGVAAAAIAGPIVDKIGEAFVGKKKEIDGVKGFSKEQGGIGTAKAIGATKGGITGALTGAALGSFLGPVGTAVGALIGGLSGSLLGAFSAIKEQLKFQELEKLKSSSEALGTALDKLTDKGFENIQALNGVTKASDKLVSQIVSSTTAFGNIDNNRGTDTFGGSVVSGLGPIVDGFTNFGKVISTGATLFEKASLAYTYAVSKVGGLIAGFGLGGPIGAIIGATVGPNKKDAQATIQRQQGIVANVEQSKAFNRSLNAIPDEMLEKAEKQFNSLGSAILDSIPTNNLTDLASLSKDATFDDLTASLKAAGDGSDEFRKQLDAYKSLQGVQIAKSAKTLGASLKALGGEDKKLQQFFSIGDSASSAFLAGFQRSGNMETAASEGGAAFINAFQRTMKGSGSVASIVGDFDDLRKAVEEAGDGNIVAKRKIERLAVASGHSVSSLTQLVNSVVSFGKNTEQQAVAMQRSAAKQRIVHELLLATTQGIDALASALQRLSGGLSNAVGDFAIASGNISSEVQGILSTVQNVKPINRVNVFAGGGVGRSDEELEGGVERVRKAVGGDVRAFDDLASTVQLGNDLPKAMKATLDDLALSGEKIDEGAFRDRLEEAIPNFDQLSDVVKGQLGDMLEASFAGLRQGQEVGVGSFRKMLEEVGNLDQFVKLSGEAATALESSTNSLNLFEQKILEAGNLGVIAARDRMQAEMDILKKKASMDDRFSKFDPKKRQKPVEQARERTSARIKTLLNAGGKGNQSLQLPSQTQLTNPKALLARRASLEKRGLQDRASLDQLTGGDKSAERITEKTPKEIKTLVDKLSANTAALEGTNKAIELLSNDMSELTAIESQLSNIQSQRLSGRQRQIVDLKRLAAAKTPQDRARVKMDMARPYIAAQKNLAGINLSLEEQISLQEGLQEGQSGALARYLKIQDRPDFIEKSAQNVSMGSYDYLAKGLGKRVADAESGPIKETKKEKQLKSRKTTIVDEQTALIEGLAKQHSAAIANQQTILQDELIKTKDKILETKDAFEQLRDQQNKLIQSSNARRAQLTEIEHKTLSEEKDSTVIEKEAAEQKLKNIQKSLDVAKKGPDNKSLQENATTIKHLKSVAKSGRKSIGGVDNALVPIIAELERKGSIERGSDSPLAFDNLKSAFGTGFGGNDKLSELTGKVGDQDAIFAELVSGLELPSSTLDAITHMRDLAMEVSPDTKASAILPDILDKLAKDLGAKNKAKFTGRDGEIEKLNKRYAEQEVIVKSLTDKLGDQTKAHKELTTELNSQNITVAKDAVSNATATGAAVISGITGAAGALFGASAAEKPATPDVPANLGNMSVGPASISKSKPYKKDIYLEDSANDNVKPHKDIFLNKDEPKVPQEAIQEQAKTQLQQRRAAKLNAYKAGKQSRADAYARKRGGGFLGAMKEVVTGPMRVTEKVATATTDAAATVFKGNKTPTAPVKTVSPAQVPTKQLQPQSDNVFQTVQQDVQTIIGSIGPFVDTLSKVADKLSSLPELKVQIEATVHPVEVILNGGALLNVLTDTAKQEIMAEITTQMHEQFIPKSLDN